MKAHEDLQRPKSLLPRALEARFVEEIKARRSVDEAADACGIPEEIAWQAAAIASLGGRLIRSEVVRQPDGRLKHEEQESEPDPELRALLLDLT
ncbi:hypothetical protein [Microbispora bryophytorum]|uniref:hypothetical protein n=1 Tax=Microbispora bryophytorum TaxID=1460882 RepID=UPI0033FF7C0A